MMSPEGYASARTMPAVIKGERAPGLTLVEKPIPSPAPDELLIKVRATSICGTDLHIYNWDSWAQGAIKPPVTLGHEFCGDVVEVGKDVKSFRNGDYVAAESHIYCGQCFQCRTGNRHICENEVIIGLARDGAFADYVTLPERCAWKTDRALPPHIATLQEPLGNSVHATLAGDVSRKKVVVFGCGPTGLFAVAIARLCGAAMVIAIDVNPFRLELARKMGAQHTLNAKQTNVVEAVMDLTQGRGGEVVLEMSGSPQAIQDGLRLLSRGGDFRFFGVPSDRVTLDIARDVIFKGAHIRGVVGRRIFETWFDTKALLEAGLDLNPLVTHRLPLRDFTRAFDLFKEGNCGKIVLYPQKVEE
ncbi:MAG: L-threonine 3-dehydrogenase [Planctomycetes bacterium]|nr:L-threonine 3-dehydrogenase [Planctomycetota bacterium]